MVDEELEEKINQLAHDVEVLVQKESRQEYNLFLSHSWSYDEQYNNLAELLEDFPYFEFKNYSVPSDDPLDADTAEELVEMLLEQIQPASVVIILAGMYVNHSDIIGAEMDIADQLNKPMLGVKPWGNDRIPSEVEEQVDEVVGWQAHSVVGAIRELSE